MNMSWNKLFLQGFELLASCDSLKYRISIQRSVRIKQLQEFLKSDNWLRRYCIFSVGYFILSHPVFLHVAVKLFPFPLFTNVVDVLTSVLMIINILQLLKFRSRYYIL